MARRAWQRDAGRVAALREAPLSPRWTKSDRLAVPLADADPGLLGTLEGPLAAAARKQLVAQTLWRDAGRWEPPKLGFDGWLGMLVLDGLLVRQTDVDGLRCCELLGPGDLLRPWDEDDAGATLAARNVWRVLEPTRLALLDRSFASRAARWPAVSAELMQRSLRRTRAQSVLLAITQARRADARLRILFAHLADRWGRVTPEGIVLPLCLTHSVIAQLTGLRRPSVSISLGELERSGEIMRLSKHHWLLAQRAS
jgi:hypothetical protein